MDSPLGLVQPIDPKGLTAEIGGNFVWNFGLVEALLEDGLVGKPVIPSNPVSIFQPYSLSLRVLYENQSGEHLHGRVTKKRLWLDMLKTASMAPSQAAEDRLFVTHSFLVAVARGAIATLVDPSAEKLDGVGALRDGFAAWVVDSHAGSVWAQDLFAAIHSYEWRQQEGDVLRPLYESLVSARDRKIFGEYYTPDWLADLMVREVLDESWRDRAVDAALKALRTGSEVRGGRGVGSNLRVRHVSVPCRPQNLGLRCCEGASPRKAV